MVQLEIMQLCFALRNTILAAWGEVTLGLQTGIAFVAALFTGLLDQLVPGWQAGMAIIAMSAQAAWNTFMAAGKVALAVIQAGLNALTEALARFFKGMQIATSAFVATAPQTLQGSNQEIKKFLGLDIGKILGGAGTAAADANASGREKLGKEQADREAKDQEAIDAQRKAIADKQAELDELRRKAAEAKEQAAAGVGAPGSPRLPDTAELARRVSVGFSAAGLIASASGGRDAHLSELKAIRQAAEKQVEIAEKIKDKPNVARAG
jgi:hypothetical protein